MTGWWLAGDRTIRRRLIIASGIVGGFAYGVVHALINEGSEPGFETVIGVVIYCLVAATVALRPNDVVERGMHTAAMTVGALWSVMAGVMVPYALGIDGRDLREFAREINDDIEWWWVYGQWAMGSLFGGAIFGFILGVLSHGAVFVARRFAEPTHDRLR